MGQTYKNFISSLNSHTSVSDIYKMLISVLDYKDSANFNEIIPKTAESLFDAEYRLWVDDNYYTILGIKILDTKDEEIIARNHLRFWNKNDTPFSILVLPNEVRVYNNFTIKRDKLLFKSSDSTADIAIFEAFSNESIVSGVVEERLEALIKRKNRIDYRLLENLRTTIISLHENYNMELKNAYTFLAQCIFVKYLEDRKMITSNMFLPYHVNDFTGLLDSQEPEKISLFFYKLKERFNGDLFNLEENTLLPDSKQLNLIADFFKGDDLYIDGSRQISLFYYDFSIIPIELISNIYEMFFDLGDKVLKTDIASSNGAYYTPYFLADFMVKKSFEYKNLSNKSTITVLDPACGSGIFLVCAFKKMIKDNINAGNKVDTQFLKSILTTKIYGIDTNEQALQIACFSLYIALLDYLEPKDILENNFKFPSLKSNLICASFFDPNLNALGISADIVIGNPPWISSKEPDIIKYVKENECPVSDFQLAQLFPLRCADFSKDDTIISLILANSIFVNHHAQGFRTALFSKFKVLEVLNLHRLKNTLFLNASAPCTIITYELGGKEDFSFDYFAFKPNLITKLFDKVVYDKEEIIRIKKSVIQNNDSIWRILTFGDDFDINVLKRLRQNPTLRTKMDNYELEYGRGYAVGIKDKYRPEFLEYRGGNLKGYFNKYGIDYESLPFMTKDEFERPRPLSFYQFTNKILIKRTFSQKNWGAAFSNQYIIFSDDFHQIADKTEKNWLLIKYLEALYNSDLFYYYSFLCSKIFISIKPELSKEDLLDFPIPIFDENSSEIKCICEAVQELENLIQEEFSLPPLDARINNILERKEELEKKMNDSVYALYNLDDIEKETIDYTLKCIMPEALNLSAQYILAAESDYNAYTQWICDYFNKLLNSQGFYMCSSSHFTKRYYTIITFTVYDNSANECESFDSFSLLKELPDVLGISSIELLDGEMLVKNKISGFLPNGFFVIKTKEYKNWTKMSAIKDAHYFTKAAFTYTQEAVDNGY